MLLLEGGGIIHAKTNLPFAFILGLLMFSLAGIPPLAGFWAKWYVFLPAIKAGLYPLSVIGVVTSVIGAFYYLRIVKIMFFDEPVGSLRAERRQDVCGNGALGGVHARIRAAFYRRRARRCRHGRCHGIEARCSVVDWR